MTLEEYSKLIVKPGVLSGVRSGCYDTVLPNWLMECPPPDPDIIAAVLERLKVLAITPPQPSIFEEPGGPVGSTLRIKLPDGYGTSSGILPWNRKQKRSVSP